MGRKKYSCDFETTTDAKDCRVWAWAYTEIGKKSNSKIGNNMDEFMSWVEKCQGDLYFHNLRFDGSFIINWLLTHGFEFGREGKENTFNAIISNMGQWYMIDITYGWKVTPKGKKKLHTVIYDSLKKLPFPVKKIAKDFKLEIAKGEIDYHQFREKGYEITDDEKEYIINDVEIVSQALEMQFKQGLNKMTTGSDSLNGFKDMIGQKTFEKLFPVFSLELNEEMRLAYKGGFTWVNEKYQGKELGAGMVFDVNSLYPSVMYYKPLVYGLPKKFFGEYVEDTNYPMYIQHIKCEFELKDGYIPCIQIKDNFLFKQNEYLKSSNFESVDLYVTNIDLEMIKEHYHLYNVEYLEGAKFMKCEGVFKSFIDKWMYIKVTSTGAAKIAAKLQLNSLYGKFATNPDVTGKEPYLKPDGSNGFRTPRDEEGNVIKDYKDPVYTPMGVFITSWARYITISTAQRVYDRIIYCDTDSIHILGTDIPDVIKDVIDPDKLGFWKHESTFNRAKFLRQKTYVEEIDGHLDVKCAGMPEKIKEFVTFENFEVGFSSPGKLLPKQVPGGVVLEDTEFTIK